MGNLPDWFTNEAISNYIVFFAGLIVGLIVWTIRTNILGRKPVLIKVEKDSENSLLDIAPEARDRLHVTFQGQQIFELHQTTYSITNLSNRPLEDISLVFHLERETNDEIIEIVFDDPLDGIRPPTILNDDIEENNPKIIIKLAIPYLNPFKEYEDLVTLKIYSPKSTNLQKVTGGGLGWATKYFDRVEYNKRIEKIASESNSLVDILTSSIVKSILLRRNNR